MKSHALRITLFLCVTTHAFAEDDEPNTRMMRASLKINHERSTATGFLLAAGPENKMVLVTANHVFENTPGDETSLIFRRKQAEGEYAKLPTRLSIRKDGKPLWVKHPTADIAVIRVNPPQEADIALLPVDALTSDEDWRTFRVHPGEELAFLGYPHREESSKAGFPMLRRGPIASFPLLPTVKTRTFYLSGNVFEGDSGGPVYLTREGWDAPMILGLVAAQRFLDEEIKTIDETSKIRHRLSLAVVIHASLIREAVGMVKQ